MDQNNNEEKSQQVGIMHKIYKATTGVQIWLGEADHQTESAFALMEQLAQEGEYYGLSSHDDFPHNL